MKSPVIFIIFNRPDTTKKVFEAIRKAQPPQLLVVADGARDNHPDDIEKCNVVRAIINNVDWDCEVLTNYSGVNMGCKHRVSSGLDWAFSIVEEAIILEDDCLPHPTFFRFCDEMLEHYRDDTRIGMISGDNFQFEKKRTDYSYYFSKYLHIWGWATWKRAWSNYDIDMKTWTEILKDDWLKDILHTNKSVGYWRNIFNRVFTGEIDTWDYQWVFSCFIRDQKSIVPNVNLVSNIGFGSDALHTTKKNKHVDTEIKPICFPLSHPPYIICDSKADSLETKNLFSDNSMVTKLLRRQESKFSWGTTTKKTADVYKEMVG